MSTDKSDRDGMNSNLCRCCLNLISNPEHTNAMPSFKTVLTLKDMLEECLNVQLTINDKLPQKICVTCHDTFVRFRQLKRQARANQTILEMFSQQATNFTDENVLHFRDTIHHDEIFKREQKSESLNIKQERLDLIASDYDDDDNINLADLLSKCSETSHVKRKKNRLKSDEKYACSQCASDTFENSRELRKHKSRDHPAFYHCDKCNGNFKKNAYLRKHRVECERTIKNDVDEFELNDFHCARCQLKLDNLHELCQHETRVHVDDMPLRCVVCGRIFDALNALQEHLKRHDIAPYACVFEVDGVGCAEKFFRLRLYVNHAQAVHRVDKSIKCIVPECQAKFHLIEELQVHVNGKHAEISEKSKRVVGKSTCFMCNKQVKRLAVHYREVHKIVKSQIDVKPRRCNKCPELVFKTIRDKKRHDARVHFNKKMCPHCGLYVRDTNITKHILYHQKNARNLQEYSCDLCDKKFNVVHNLRHHRLRQHCPPQSCPICKKSISYTYMKRHIATKHQGASTFKCVTCGREFLHQDSLDKHKVKHDLNQVPSFSCFKCGVTFYSRNKYTRHRATAACLEKNKITD